MKPLDVFQGVPIPADYVSAGYEASGGGFRNALGRLRTLELINRGQPVRLDETLGDAITGAVV